MKILKFFAVFALCAAACVALVSAAPAAQGPAIKFDSKDHDFGTIGAEGGPVSHTFTFTNTGSAPLIIVSATASCGCTRPEYTTEPVKPGKKGTIKVTYLHSGQPLGEFGKNVRVRTNAGGRRETLKISGVIIPGDKKPAERQQ